MKILKHSSSITLLSNVSCSLETTGDLCLNSGMGTTSRGVEAQKEGWMCVGQSWHLATPQRVSTACSYLSGGDECQSWKGGLLASCCFPPFSFPAYLSRPRACPVYQAECVLFSVKQLDCEFCLGTNLQLLQPCCRPHPEPFNIFPVT